VTYSSVGSGSGITLSSADKTAFGASDAPINQVELAVADGRGSSALQLPNVQLPQAVQQRSAGTLDKLRAG